MTTKTTERPIPALPATIKPDALGRLVPISRILAIIGAYGRDYSSGFTAEADWDAGRDFKVCGGSYCSKRDLGTFRDAGYRQIAILDKSGMELVFINL